MTTPAPPPSPLAGAAALSTRPLGEAREAPALERWRRLVGERVALVVNTPG